MKPAICKQHYSPFTSVSTCCRVLYQGIDVSNIGESFDIPSGSNFYLENTLSLFFAITLIYYEYIK